MKKVVLIAISVCVISVGYAQTSGVFANGQLVNQQLNTITTAVPVLLIAPDSRSGAMGDVGVAISPDANSMHWNASKLAFAEQMTGNEFEISLSYSPWLKALVPDINLAYLSGYYQMDENSTIGGSLRYFSLGSITFTNITGQVIRDFNPNEFSLDFGYARKLGEFFSMGVVGKYVYSNLTGGTPAAGQTTKAGHAGAVDVSAYYVNEELTVGGNFSTLSLGLNISNIGNKMSYTTATADRDFIPTNLRLGSALLINFDEYNTFTFAFDVNKLLVPTPPIYKKDDSTGNYIPIPNTNSYVIDAGKDPNVGVATGIFQSFSDAPGWPLVDDGGDPVRDDEGNLLIEKGSRFKEEMREINLSFGMEYWYSGQFAVRGGFFYEHPTKGNRQFFTLGAGLKYSVFALDLSYLIPTQQRNPLANTLRFSLKFNFESMSNTESAKRHFNDHSDRIRV